MRFQLRCGIVFFGLFRGFKLEFCLNLFIRLHGIKSEIKGLKGLKGGFRKIKPRFSRFKKRIKEAGKALPLNSPFELVQRLPAAVTRHEAFLALERLVTHFESVAVVAYRVHHV